MPETRTYRGGCHCGAVAYDVTTDLAQVITCNCSICTKRGLLLTFVGPQQFSLLTPDTPLTDYQFHSKIIHHRFCPTCGVESFAEGSTSDGSPVFAINVRCLEGVDIASLKPKAVDGRSF